MWCVAELDEQYIGKMEDVLAVYEKPYDATQPVVCLDEKPIALHADVRSPIPAKPGKPAKQDNEYERCGTANVFGVVEPKTGRHFTRRHRIVPAPSSLAWSGMSSNNIPSPRPSTLSWITSIATVATRSSTTTASKRADTFGIG